MRLEEQIYSMPDTAETNDLFGEMAERLWGREAARNLLFDRVRRQNERSVRAAERDGQ